MSFWEYANIVGHYNRLVKEDKVDPRLLAKGFTPEQIEAMQSKMSKKPSEWISLDLHFKGNIDRWEYPIFNHIITLFDQYDRNGVLPYPGAHGEQPAKIIELFQIFEQLKIERENKLHEENKRRMERERQKSKRK